MRILRSIRFRHVLALLLAYAGWAAFLWWVMPNEVRPRLTFSTTAEEIQDISPDGHMIFAKRMNGYNSLDGYTRFSQEYWDTRTGKRIEDGRSDELKEFFSGFYAESPYAWDFALAESYIRCQQAIHKEPVLNLGRVGNGSRWCGNVQLASHCSENGRFIAYPVKNGEPHFRSDIPPDGVVIVDMHDGNSISQLKGSQEVLAIAPDGRTAVTEIFYRDGLFNGPMERLILWNLQTGMAISDLERSEKLANEMFYSADGQFVFAAVRNWTTVDRFTWWRTDGRLVGDIVCPTGTDSGSSMQDLSGTGSSQVLVDFDRILVTYYSGDEFERHQRTKTQYARHEFWDVATGQKLGEWRRDDKSEIIRQPDMVCSRNGRYVGIFCERPPPAPPVWWRKQLDTIIGWFAPPKPQGYQYYVIVMDAIEQ